MCGNAEGGGGGGLTGGAGNDAFCGTGGGSGGDQTGASGSGQPGVGSGGTSVDRFPGGGGGGGYYGGGGGGEGSGGGGGSGFGPAGTTFQTAVRPGNGVITVSYTTTIADLIASVQALDYLPNALKNDLLKKLTEAQKRLAAGKTRETCDKLRDFIAKVKHEPSGRSTPTTPTS